MDIFVLHFFATSPAIDILVQSIYAHWICGYDQTISAGKNQIPMVQVYVRITVDRGSQRVFVSVMDNQL